MPPPAPSHVSFCGDFNKEHLPEQSAGRDVTDVLVAGLVSRGIQIRSRSQTDYSHEIFLSVGGRSFYAMLGLVEDAHAEWLFVFDPRNPIFRLFPSFNGSQRTLLANAVHDVLSSDQRINEIRWYKDDKAWNYHSYEAFSRAPQA